MQYVLLALRAISTLAYNPMLGRSQAEAGRIKLLMDQLAFLIENGDDLYEDLKVFATEVQALAEKGIEPNTQQWAAMIQRDRSSRDKLAARKAQLQQDQDSDGGSGEGPGEPNPGESPTSSESEPTPGDEGTETPTTEPTPE